MKKGDGASPSIILAGRALLVKMLITLESHGMDGSNCVYLCILTLSSHLIVQKKKSEIQGGHFCP